MANGQWTGGNPEVLTFGESMLLLMPDNSRGIENNSMLQKSFGGAESNLAIGIARLGHRAGWFGRLGEDSAGRYILKQIRGEGVDVSRAGMTGDAPTGLMLRETVAGKTSVYYYRKYSAASEMRPEHLDEDYIASAKILHITGITAALSGNCRDTLLRAVEIAKANQVKISFDPNLRLKLWSLEEARAALLPIAEQADYFLPGLGELKLLYDTDDEGAIEQRLHQLKGISVVKGAGKETLLFEGGHKTAVPYFPVEEEVDPVGAGDAFCAGFLTGVLKGYSHQEAVRLGNLLGSMAVQVIGDWEAAPRWEQVEAVLHNIAHVER